MENLLPDWGYPSAGTARDCWNSAGIHKLVALVPCASRPISRPMPRRCHLRCEGRRARQIRCSSTRPKGYLAKVVIRVALIGFTHRYERRGHFFHEKEVGWKAPAVAGRLGACAELALPLRS